MFKRKISGISLVLIFAIIASFAIYLRQHYVVPILMYHSVESPPYQKNMLTVSANTFQRQMAFLKEHKYNILPLEKLAELIKGKKKIPPRTVAITFDDGYKDVYTYAFPILKKYNIPATLFIIVNEVGRPQADRLGWDEIKEMQSCGIIVFGSHALGPEPLTNLKSEEEIKRQVFDSKKALEQRLGREVALFSYPEGRFNAKIRQLVIAAGYQAAVATKPGKEYPADDIFALKRLRISENAGNMFVFWFETSGFYTFFKERRHK